MKRVPIVLAAALMVAGLGSELLHAQTTYDCFYVKSTHLARLRGMVLDRRGRPVRGAKIELLKGATDDAPASIMTDADGSFRFSVPGGKYGVRVEAHGFQPSGLNIIVDHGLFSFFNMKSLYVVLAAGGTGQSCPPEITSKRKLQEYIKDNATQK